MNSMLIALRNLQRNRRRSASTLLTMAIGIMAILVFGGYALDVKYGLQTNFVRHSGHLQIQHQNYFLYGSGDPLSYGIANYQHVVDVLKSDPELNAMITVVTPVLAVNGIAGNFDAGVSRTVSGTGVVVADQNRLRAWNDYGFPGQAKTLPLTGSSSDAALIGTGVARVLNLCAPLGIPDCISRGSIQAGNAQASANDKARVEMPADLAHLAAVEAHHDKAAPAPARPTVRIELLSSSAHGAPNVASLNVLAAEKQGVKELDDMFIQMHLSQAQRLIYGQDHPMVTSIVVQLRHTSDVGRARARIRQLLGTTLRDDPLNVLDFETINPQYGQITGMFGAVFGFVTVLIATVVMFTVGNAMNMTVMERTAEIGTLRAIGLRASRVRNLFVCEGIVLGICGTALGVLCATVLAMVINHAGLHWIPPGQTEPVAITIRMGDPTVLLRTSLGVIVVATLSSWWPARRAARMRIVDALRTA